MVTNTKKALAEFLGTFWLVLSGCGSAVGAGVLYIIVSGQAGFDIKGGLASNGYEDHSPGGY